MLGIAQGSDEDAINSAFKRLCVTWHPDKHPAASKDHATKGFQLLLEAKNSLLGTWFWQHVELCSVYPQAYHTGHHPCTTPRTTPPPTHPPPCIYPWSGQSKKGSWTKQIQAEKQPVLQGNVKKPESVRSARGGPQHPHVLRPQLGVVVAAA